MDIHGNVCLSPRLRVTDFLPYVRIGVLLTAARASLSGGCLRVVEDGRTTLTSEPVSTKKWVCVCKYLMKNRRLGHWPRASVAAYVWPGSFPNCMAPCISELPRQIWYGTSKGNLWSKIVDGEGQDSMYGGMWTYFAGRAEPSRM